MLFRSRPANLHLAMIVCGVALLLATPLVSFNAISTRDQVARLESGKVTPDKFDWAALAFDFGDPGRKALERLKASSDAEIRRTATDIAKKERRWDIDQAEPDPAPRLAALEKRLRILPRPVAVPPGLGEVLMSERACGSDEARCTLWLSQASSEALVFQDDCFDSIEKQPEPTTFHARSLSCTAPRRFVAVSGKWAEAEANELARRSDADRAAAEQSFKSGAIEIRPVQRRQVFVGGVPVGDPFE